MFRNIVPSVGGVLIAASVVGVAVAGGQAATQSTHGAPHFDADDFVAGAPIDNTYFPFPAGRVLVYRGVKDGQSQRDTVTVTSRTKDILGVRATVVRDVSVHGSTLLEKTDDYYAQDKQGNVWYLGEKTAAYDPDGTVDTSGSWQAGVNGALPGIVMEANPRVPDAYRQEFLAGEAEDTAWVVDRGGTITVPYGRVQRVLTTLEATAVEPGSYDKKVYGPGLGIVLEQALSGPPEVAKLVSVTDR